ncbi:MAG: HD domain-containing phosphohydrolase [Pyrinomonadaceae bacterium]
MSHKIMVVDDEPANLRLLERLFRHEYQVITAASGDEALRLLEQYEVALLITDQRMPGMTGTELLERAAAFRPHMVRMILTGYTDVGALVDAINCGQVYKYVTKPWSNEDLQQTVSRAIEHYDIQRRLHELSLSNARLTTRLQEMTRGFVRAISDALEAKDEHMYGHSRRVSGYATAIGRKMQLDEERLEQISLAALLHDIGKIGTPDHLLLKPGLLTPEERAIVELHSERGARMLAGIPEMSEVADAVRHHHERFDGTGYPDGLQGGQIPLVARIILVADAYDAMTSPRPFRNALNHEAAVAQLEDAAGTQFDLDVVRAFCRLDTLAQIRQSIAQIFCGTPLLPTSRMIEASALSFEELWREVKIEPVLAAYALFEANAGETSEHSIASVEVACAQLGETRLRAIMQQNAGHEDASLRPVCEHSLRTAEAARLLAEETNFIDGDQAYTLGLLHNLGEMLLLSLFPAEMMNIESVADDEHTEREVVAFGVDHAQIGQWILEACGMPRELAAAVQTHHDPMRINDPVALLLHVANAIAQTDVSQKMAALDALGADRLAVLGIDRAGLGRIYERAAVAIEHRLAMLC